MMNQQRQTNCAFAIVAMLALFLFLGMTVAAQNLQIAAQRTSVEAASATQQNLSPALLNSIESLELLPLAANSLHASQPLVEEKDILPGYTRELIQLQWRPADPIDLYIIRPNDVVKPPAVLFLYGYPTDTDKFRNDAFCRNVVKHGFAAVGFVSALTGHRYHDRPMKEWFVSELRESLVFSVHDVQMILNYLATRSDLDLDRVGIFGQGSGGTIAILSANADPRIKAVDVMDPWGDWSDWIVQSPQIPEHERSDYLKPAFLAKIAPMDPVRSMSQLKGRPFRLQENLFNLTMPGIVRKQIESAAPDTARIVEYRDTHEYGEKVSANGKMLDWMQDALRDSSSSTATRMFPQKDAFSNEPDHQSQ